MAHLVKIGNSQGIRIPKPLIEQAKLEGKDLKLQVVNDGLLVTPKSGVRDGWKESTEALLKDHGEEELDTEWLDVSLSSDDEIEW